MIKFISKKRYKELLRRESAWSVMKSQREDEVNLLKEKIKELEICLTAVTGDRDHLVNELERVYSER